MRVKIRELAKKADKSFIKVSRDLDMTERTLYRWNSGEKMPNKATLVKLAKYFKCKMADLIEF